MPLFTFITCMWTVMYMWYILWYLYALLWDFHHCVCDMCCVFGISSRLVKTKGKVCVLNESIFCELLPTHPSMCKRLHVACTALLLQLQRILTWIVRWLHMWALLTPDGPLMESLTLSTHIHRDRTLTMVWWLKFGHNLGFYTTLFRFSGGT